VGEEVGVGDVLFTLGFIRLGYGSGVAGSLLAAVRGGYAALVAEETREVEDSCGAYR